MSDQVGTADIKAGNLEAEDVPVYAYHDPETNTNYRSIFISELPSSRDTDSMPMTAAVMYRGNRYKAMKFGNPNNQIPTYDWKVTNKL